MHMDTFVFLTNFGIRFYFDWRNLKSWSLPFDYTYHADNHVHFEVEQERALMAQNPEAAVVFGVLNETSETESRVALTPDIVTRLKRSGVSSIIEAGAGIAAEYTDEDQKQQLFPIRHDEV